MVARWSANLLGFWPETDAAFVTSGDGGLQAAARRPVIVMSPDRTMYQMSLVPRLDLRPVKLKKAEHDDPGEHDQARKFGRRRTYLGPPSTAPDAHEQHQVPGDVRSEHQHRKPSRRTGGNKHQGEQCGEQADDAPTQNAPEPESTA